MGVFELMYNGFWMGVGWSASLAAVIAVCLFFKYAVLGKNTAKLAQIQKTLADVKARRNKAHKRERGY